MMSEQTDNITPLLAKFGLTQPEAAIYLYLKKNSLSTALKISRDLHIGRTKVYRVLDTLTDKKLVAQNISDRGLQFETTPSENLTLLVLERKTQLEELTTAAPILIESLNSLQKTTANDGAVRYYKGSEGLKQVTWNSLKAEKELLIYEMVTDMSKFLTKEFSEEVRKEIVKRRIKVRQLTNHTHIPSYTKITQKVLQYWEPRYINPKTLKISYEILIYNDVVAHYSVRGKELFCVEITDKRLASMQKDIFRYVWSTAEKMKIVSPYGEAKVQ